MQNESSYSLEVKETGGHVGETKSPQQVHDFKEKLAWSQQASHEAFWKAVYHKAFPDMVNQMLSVGNTQAQHDGIDRVILLNNGAVLRIDEKKRAKVYDDILLEYVSNDQANTPGWIEKALRIDYLAYAFMPTQTVYLFPWLLLRRAWLHFGADWKKKYKTVKAANSGYNTLSLVVPISVVRGAVHRAEIIKVSADDVKPFSHADTTAAQAGGESASALPF